jgi:hypothetical protein
VGPVLVQRYLLTDSASILSDRQRIASLSACPGDSASLRFVSVRTSSGTPAVTLPTLRLA